MTEHQAFTNFRDLIHTDRLNGWTVWVVSLSHRGFKNIEAIQGTRPAFDIWLASVRLTDWTEFDAWMAAAHYAEHS